MSRRASGLPALVAGLFLALFPRPGEAAAPQHVAGEPALEERAAAALAEGLGYTSDELPLGRHVLVGVAVERRQVVFTLDAADRGRREALIGLHPGAVAEGNLERVATTATLSLYARPPVGADLRETAGALASRLPAVPWAVPDEGPPFTPPPAVASLLAGSEAGGGTGWLSSPTATRVALTAVRSLAPLLAWSTVLLGAWVLAGRLRASPRRGRGWELLAIGALAAGLRLWFSEPWPLSFVEVERVLPSPSCVFAFFPEALGPLVGWADDPLAAQGWFNLSASLVTVAGTALLGEAWFGGRVGSVAGILVAVSCWPIVFSRTSTVEVALAAALVLAVGLTELALRRPERRALLASVLAWALVVQLRPESVGLVLAPALWLLADPRWRGAPRTGPRRWPLVVAGVALGVAAAMARGLLCGGSMAEAALDGEAFRRPAEVLVGNAGDLVLDPRWHEPTLVAAAVLGLAVGGGAWRVVVALLGFVLPVLLFSLKGRAIGDTPFDVTDLRYVLPALPFLALAAVAPLARALAIPPGWARRLALYGLLVLLAAVPLGAMGRVLRADAPAPLQAEHAFVARIADRLPPGAAVLVFDTTDGGGDASCPQLDYRLGVLARRRGDPSAPLALDPQAFEARSGVGELYYLRGWFELRSAGHPELEAFLAHLAARYVVEPVVLERAVVSLARAPWKVELPLLLARLTPRAVAPER